MSETAMIEKSGGRVWVGYPFGFKPRTVAEQMATWQRLLPEMNQGDGCSRGDWDTPDRGEFWGVLPAWRVLASKRHEALGRMLTLLVQHGGQSYNIEPGLDDQFLRIDPRVNDTLIGDKVLSAGNYRIVPVQFGSRRLVKAPASQVWSRLQSGEVILSVHDVLGLMIANPGRVMTDNDLGLECAGSFAYVDDGGATRSEAITICYRDGKVVIGPHNYRAETTDFGVATAFVE